MSAPVTWRYVCTVPVSGADLLSIDEPLDLEPRVVDGLQAALEVGVLSLLKVLQAAGTDGEGRGGGVTA